MTEGICHILVSLELPENHCRAQLMQGR